MNLLREFLPYIQIILSVCLIALILMQRSDANVSAAFGGDSLGGGTFERRGAEKLLFNITIACAILFAVFALIALI